MDDQTFQDKIIIDGDVVMVLQDNWMPLDQLDPGTLAKMWSDKADSLTFLITPFRYSRRKKARRFVIGCFDCLRHRRSWVKWRRHIKEDRASVYRLAAELRTIERFLKLLDPTGGG